MSRVYLLRHAKAKWASPGMSDIDRPLDPEGETAARTMGETMAEKGLAPDIIVISPATRTRETLRNLTRAHFAPFRIVEEEALFSGGADAYLDAIRSADDAASVMLVGHNPMIEEVAIALVAQGEPALVRRLHDGFPAGGLAVIDFTDSLADVKPASGNLVAFLRPSDL